MYALPSLNSSLASHRRVPSNALITWANAILLISCTSFRIRESYELAHGSRFSVGGFANVMGGVCLHWTIPFSFSPAVWNPRGDVDRAQQ